MPDDVGRCREGGHFVYMPDGAGSVRTLGACKSVCRPRMRVSARPYVRASVRSSQGLYIKCNVRAYVGSFHPLFVMSARVFASILRTRFDSNRLFRPQFYELVSIKMRFR